MEKKELWFKPNQNTNGINVSRKKRLLWRLVDQYLFKPSPNILRPWRVWLLRLFGAKIGNNCYISQRATIYSPWKLRMGSFCSIDDYCTIISEVQLGDYVSIGIHANLIAGGHDVFSRGFETTGRTIFVGNGAFIGAGSYIGAGVKIGQMAVIGAHSYIVKDVCENTITTMMPMKTISCRRLKTEEYEKYRYNYIED